MQISFRSGFLILFFCLFFLKLSAQNDTIFFDKDWKISTKENALYYRINPLKIKTKKAIGYETGTDSLFVIKDYYINNNKLQFKGYSIDKDANYLAGKAVWYDENNHESYSQDFNYKQTYYHSNSFQFPESLILNLSYSYAQRNQFTAGLEYWKCGSGETKAFFGIGYGITSYNNKYYGLPDLHLSVNRNLLFIKAGTSNRHAYALAGVSAFNMMDLGIGYSLPYNNINNPVIKGFTFGVTFRITKNPDAYQKLKIM